MEIKRQRLGSGRFILWEGANSIILTCRLLGKFEITKAQSDTQQPIALLFCFPN